MSNPPPAWPGYAQAAAASGGFGPGVARIKPTPPVQQGALPASNAAPWARGQTPPGGDATSRGLGALSNAATSNATQHAVANVGHVPKARKPYTITKQRERWTDEEHERFLAALKLHGRAWRKIEEHVGTKSAVQIRSHAQKFFSKLMREAAKSGDASGVASAGVSGSASEHGVSASVIPPARPKRKPAHPYPRKAPEGGDRAKNATTMSGDRRTVSTDGGTRTEVSDGTITGADVNSFAAFGHGAFGHGGFDAAHAAALASSYAQFPAAPAAGPAAGATNAASYFNPYLLPANPTAAMYQMNAALKGATNATTPRAANATTDDAAQAAAMRRFMHAFQGLTGMPAAMTAPAAPPPPAPQPGPPQPGPAAHGGGGAAAAGANPSAATDFFAAMMAAATSNASANLGSAESAFSQWAAAAAAQQQSNTAQAQQAAAMSQMMMMMMPGYAQAAAAVATAAGGAAAADPNPNPNPNPNADADADANANLQSLADFAAKQHRPREFEEPQPVAEKKPEFDFNAVAARKARSTRAHPKAAAAARASAEPPFHPASTAANENDDASDPASEGDLNKESSPENDGSRPSSHERGGASGSGEEDERDATAAARGGGGGETAFHTTPFAWCTPFLKDFSRRHSSPALPFQRLTGKIFD